MRNAKQGNDLKHAVCVDSRSDFLELPEKNGGNVILHVLVSFHTGEGFCTLSRLSVQSGISFVCFSARLAVHYFAVRF